MHNALKLILLPDATVDMPISMTVCSVVADVAQYCLRRPSKTEPMVIEVLRADQKLDDSHEGICPNRGHDVPVPMEFQQYGPWHTDLLLQSMYCWAEMNIDVPDAVGTHRRPRGEADWTDSVSKTPTNVAVAQPRLDSIEARRAVDISRTLSTYLASAAGAGALRP